MVMPHHIHVHLSLWSNFWYGEGHPLATLTILYKYSSRDFFLFSIYLVAVPSPDNSSAQPSFRIFQINLDKIIYVTHFRNDFRGWNYVNQTVENTLKGCNVHFNIWMKCFWDTVQCPLRIEQPSCICIEEKKRSLATSWVKQVGNTGLWNSIYLFKYERIKFAYFLARKVYSLLIKRYIIDNEYIQPPFLPLYYTAY